MESKRARGKSRSWQLHHDHQLGLTTKTQVPFMCVCCALVIIQHMHQSCAHFQHKSWTQPSWLRRPVSSLPPPQLARALLSPPLHVLKDALRNAIPGHLHHHKAVHNLLPSSPLNTQFCIEYYPTTTTHHTTPHKPVTTSRKDSNHHHGSSTELNFDHSTCISIIITSYTGATLHQDTPHDQE